MPSSIVYQCDKSELLRFLKYYYSCLDEGTSSLSIVLSLCRGNQLGQLFRCYSGGSTISQSLLFLAYLLLFMIDSPSVGTLRDSIMAVDLTKINQT